ncbi:MAG: division/cell wall cluster transcriptional repressor MraZ [Deltaproteobacteria bacterium]|nr:division/cell wall cluster transcriptional repressor MraZ [Deltaproteobacteria bacterium]
MAETRRKFQDRQKVDAKGRILLPAPMRQDLSDLSIEGLVTTFHPGFRSLWVFTPDAWERWVAAFRGRAAIDSRLARMQHALLAGACDVRLDSAGRVLVPAHLRDRAGLVREVVIHDVDDRWEIWDIERWAAYEETLFDSYPSIEAEYFRDLGETR